MTLQRAALLTYAMGWRDPKTTLRRYQAAQRRYHAVILDEIARALAGPRLGRHRREWLLRLRRTLA